MTQTPAHVHCGCKVAHEPAQALADLLHAAIEVDEIADIVLAHSDLTIAERARFTALRVAVRRLEGAR